MDLTRGPTGVVAGLEPLVESGVVNPPGNDEHFFRIGVALPANIAGIRSWQKPRESGVLPRVVVDAERQFLSSSFKSLNRRPLALVPCGKGIPIGARDLGHSVSLRFLAVTEGALEDDLSTKNPSGRFGGRGSNESGARLVQRPTDPARRAKKQPEEEFVGARVP